MPAIGKGFPCGGSAGSAGASRSCLSLAWEQRLEVPELWRGGPQGCQICPALPVCPHRDTGEGRSIPARAPEPPAGLCRQRPHCATASRCVPPGLALAPLCAGSWRLWVCVSNFKGMSYFLEKMDRLSKKQITPTREGALIGASLWTLTGPPGAGPGALHCRDRGKRCRWEIRARMPWGYNGQEAAPPTPLPACGKSRCQASPSSLCPGAVSPWV